MSLSLGMASVSLIGRVTNIRSARRGRDGQAWRFHIGIPGDEHTNDLTITVWALGDIPERADVCKQVTLGQGLAIVGRLTSRTDREQRQHIEVLADQVTPLGLTDEWDTAFPIPAATEEAPPPPARPAPPAAPAAPPAPAEQLAPPDPDNTIAGGPAIHQRDAANPVGSLLLHER